MRAATRSLSFMTRSVVRVAPSRNELVLLLFPQKSYYSTDARGALGLRGGSEGTAMKRLVGLWFRAVEAQMMRRFNWSEKTFRVWFVIFAVITLVQLGDIVQLLAARETAAPDEQSRLVQQMFHDQMNGQLGGALGFKQVLSRGQIDDALGDAVLNWGLMFLLSVGGVQAVLWIRRSTGEQKPASGSPEDSSLSS